MIFNPKIMRGKQKYKSGLGEPYFIQPNLSNEKFVLLIIFGQNGSGS